MKKTLIIRHIQEPENAEGIHKAMEEAGISFVPIDSANWQDQFPYCPQVHFRIAYTDEAILLEYRVQEETVMALAGKDNGNVWQDSCVEFFIQPEEGGIYLNFECNCASSLLLGMGQGRSGRNLASQEVIDRVERWSTYASERIFQEKRTGMEPWTACLRIPKDVIFGNETGSLSGKTARGNFYKCGDHLSRPHYLSWSPISLENPNFHCPEFFGRLEFE